MIDDGTIASPAERLEYQQGLETLKRFDPFATVIGMNADGSRRQLTATEQLTNEIFNVTATYGKPYALGNVVVRSLMPIDLTDYNWIEQSLRVEADGTSVQLGNRYMGRFPGVVNTDYINSNGSLFTDTGGVLLYRGYSSDTVGRIGLTGRVRLLNALRTQRNDSLKRQK
jgi:hypothetical protein